MLQPFALVACTLLALLQQPASDDIDAKFATAERDAAQAVPLIIEASARLSRIDGDAGQRLAEKLEMFCKRVFFSPERLPDMELLGVQLHTIASGEIPGRIAARYRIGAGLLRLLNDGYDEKRLSAGAKLKVLDLSDGSLRVIVDRARFRLAAWRQAKDGAWVLVMYVPVGLGALDSPTPVGSTTITMRVRNPEWTHPITKQVHAPDDPENVLGGYWIRLADTWQDRTGIGIHGYTGAATADWIERGSSNGCVRMLQPDIDRLFELALEGTSVTITP